VGKERNGHCSLKVLGDAPSNTKKRRGKGKPADERPNVREEVLPPEDFRREGGGNSKGCGRKDTKVVERGSPPTITTVRVEGSVRNDVNCGTPTFERDPAFQVPVKEDKKGEGKTCLVSTWRTTGLGGRGKTKKKDVES